MCEYMWIGNNLKSKAYNRSQESCHCASLSFSCSKKDKKQKTKTKPIRFCRCPHISSSLNGGEFTTPWRRLALKSSRPDVFSSGLRWAHPTRRDLRMLGSIVYVQPHLHLLPPQLWWPLAELVISLVLHPRLSANPCPARGYKKKKIRNKNK